MNNKSKSWTDVQLIISSLSIAITVGFWGIFASREKAVAGVTGQATIPQQPDALISAPPALLPGQKLLFGGVDPQLQSQTQPQVQATPRPIVVAPKKHGGKGGGGGGGGGSPSAGTGSSHP